MKNIVFLITILFIYIINTIFAQAPIIEWQNTIGGDDKDYLYSIHETADGGYILGGHSSSGISGDKTEESQGDYDYWVIKLDGEGNIVWQNTIGGSSSDVLWSIHQTADGGYILGGYSFSGISGDKTEAHQNDDYWIVKLDGEGNIVWQKTIGGNGTDHLYSVIELTGGGYILGGESTSGISGDKTEECQGDYDYWAIKLDNTGNVLWDKTIGGSNYDNLHSIQPSSDGGYILGGTSFSEESGNKTEGLEGGEDYWVVKLDGEGNIVWQNTIGGSASERLYSIQQAADGGYVLGGFSYSDISGDKTEARRGHGDYWVVKLDQWGNIYWQKTIGGSNGNQLYSIYQTSDGGYILGGFSESGISGDKTDVSIGSWDYWVVKLEADAPLEVEQTVNPTKVDEFIVLPAYPNPFNPSTTLTYGIDTDSKVSIQIYNISGQLITTILNSKQTQGWHSILWNGTNNNNEQVPAGLYFGKITSNNTTKTTKLMLLK